MPRMHRILLAAGLMVATARGSLSAQSDGETINRRLEELSRVLVESFSRLERHEFRNRLAVMEFENASELARQQNLGRAFSEILTDYLSKNAGMFDVYERGQLDSVLREQEFALSDLADPEEAIEIGKLTGAHLLVLGSVFQVGNDVQVVARMVETETGQILVSHSVVIPKEVFVDISQYLVELRNSVMLDYMFLFAADGEVSTLALAYRYSFSRGLSLAFQAFLGGNHGVIPTTTTLVSDPFEWESSFTATGLAVLFGLGSSARGPVRWELRFGPALAAYHDETLLRRFYEGGSWYAGGEEIDNWYTLFGAMASATVDFSLSRNIGVYLGGQFQFYPEQEIEEDVYYELGGGGTGLVIFRRDISLTGAVVKAGMRYSF